MASKIGVLFVSIISLVSCEKKEEQRTESTSLDDQYRPGDYTCQTFTPECQSSLSYCSEAIHEPRSIYGNETEATLTFNQETNRFNVPRDQNDGFFSVENAICTASGTPTVDPVQYCRLIKSSKMWFGLSMDGESEVSMVDCFQAKQSELSDNQRVSRCVELTDGSGFARDFIGFDKGDGSPGAHYYESYSDSDCKEVVYRSDLHRFTWSMIEPENLADSFHLKLEWLDENGNLTNLSTEISITLKDFIVESEAPITGLLPESKLPQTEKLLFKHVSQWEKDEN